MKSGKKEKKTSSTNVAVKSGKKKTSQTIPTQVSSRARRKTKNSGKSSSTYGRKPKALSQRTQLDVRDEEEVVFHTLPSPKTRKKRKIHSLSDAVESTSQNEKRHKH